jgi:hypothetical protein
VAQARQYSAVIGPEKNMFKKNILIADPIEVLHV